MTTLLGKVSLLGLALFGAACAPFLASAPAPATFATPQVIAPVTATPAAPSQSAIYIVDPRNGDPVSQILVVDPDTRRVERVFQTRYEPSIAFSLDGRRLYVADSYKTQVIRGAWHDVISVYDARTGDLLHEDVEIPKRLLYKALPGGGVGDLVLSRDGRRLFVGQYGDPDIHALRLAVVDPDSLALLGEYNSPCSGYHLLPLSDGRLVCAGFSEPDVFDPSTGKTTLVATSLPAVNVSVTSIAGSRLYVVSNDADASAYAMVVDLASSPPEILTDRVQLEVPNGSKLSYSQILLSSDEQRLFVGFVSDTNSGSGTVDEIDVFDTRTWQRPGSFNPGDPAWQFALSKDGSKLYTVNPFKKSLSIFDTATFKQTTVMHDLGDSPALIVVPP